MKWPWISRKKAEDVLSTCNEYARRLDAYAQAQDAMVKSLKAELETATAAYNAMRELEQQERWRRLKAEGLVQFKDDRIRRVLGLPGFHHVDEPRIEGVTNGEG